jgi:hypothetical protein
MFTIGFFVGGFTGATLAALAVLRIAKQPDNDSGNKQIPRRF